MKIHYFDTLLNCNFRYICENKFIQIIKLNNDLNFLNHKKFVINVLKFLIIHLYWTRNQFAISVITVNNCKDLYKRFGFTHCFLFFFYRGLHKKTPLYLKFSYICVRTKHSTDSLILNETVQCTRFNHVSPTTYTVEHIILSNIRMFLKNLYMYK